MKALIALLAAASLCLAASGETASAVSHGYAPIHGLKMYYEVHGSGKPLVLIHGGGSTIESSFGRILPEFAAHYRVIAVELQAHGHTADIDRPLSFEQDADDVAALMDHLKISKASFLGFSNGGTTCLQIAIRHPALVDKLVLASALYRRDGVIPKFFDGFEGATLEKSMPGPLKAAYLKANPNPAGLQAMFNRDVARMKAFADIPDDKIRAIAAPTLVINADQDIILPEHALRLERTLQNGQLAIFPGRHGEYLGDCLTRYPHSRIPALAAGMIEEFLD